LENLEITGKTRVFPENSHLCKRPKGPKQRMYCAWPQPKALSSLLKSAANKKNNKLSFMMFFSKQQKWIGYILKLFT
jgi:hypothetical protein